MCKWIFFPLLLTSFSLFAAELKIDIDETWVPIQVEMEEASSCEFIQTFGREADGGVEALILKIEPRYLPFENEPFASIESYFGSDCIAEIAQGLQSSQQDFLYVHSYDESSMLIEFCEENEQPSVGLIKYFISPKRVATVTYVYQGEDFSKCDLVQWMTTLDQDVEFIDDEKLSEAHFSTQLDPALWTEVEDATLIGNTWLTKSDEVIRCLVIPMNGISTRFESLEAYISDIMGVYAGSCCFLDEKTALIVCAISDDMGFIEKVMWADSYVAIAAYKGELLQEYGDLLLNKIELVSTESSG